MRPQNHQRDDGTSADAVERVDWNQAPTAVGPPKGRPGARCGTTAARRCAGLEAGRRAKRRTRDGSRLKPKALAPSGSGSGPIEVAGSMSTATPSRYTALQPTKGPLGDHRRTDMKKAPALGLWGGVAASAKTSRSDHDAVAVRLSSRQAAAARGPPCKTAPLWGWRRPQKLASTEPLNSVWMNLRTSSDW